MPGQTTQFSSFSYTVPLFIASALMVREQSGVMDKSCDIKRLELRSGQTWHEPYFGALTASPLTEGVALDSATLFGDAGEFTMTPQEVGVQVQFTLRGTEAIKENYQAIAGRVMSNAIEYYRDQTGLNKIGTFPATYGSSSTFNIGLVAAAIANIRVGNAISPATARTGARPTGDPAEGPYYAIIHEYSRYDMAAVMSGMMMAHSSGAPAALSTTAATMNFTPGLTHATSDYEARWIEEHYVGNIQGTRVLLDNNYTINTTYNAGVYARDGLVHLKYRTPLNNEYREKDGRTLTVTLVDDFAWGIRVQAWGANLNLDGTAPTG